MLTVQMQLMPPVRDQRNSHLSSIAVIRFIYPFNQYHNLYQIVIVGAMERNSGKVFLRIDFEAVDCLWGILLLIHSSFIFLSNIQMLPQDEMP